MTQDGQRKGSVPGQGRGVGRQRGCCRSRIAGEGRVDRTEPMVFSVDDKTDVGSDRCTPVSDDYGTGDSDFNGRIEWIQIDLGKDAEDADHLISAEERFQIKVALQ